MKLVLILSFFWTTTLWAKPILLLSAFDTFGAASFNNSEKVATSLIKKLQKNPNFPIDVRLCILPTVYDKGAEVLQKCLAEVRGQELIGVISLGEAICELKIETMANNFDDNLSLRLATDNEGNRRQAPIINNGPQKLAFSLPLDELFCDLSPEEKKLSIVSTDTGSFVCNNSAYLFKYNEADVPFAFIHVPANNCPDLAAKNILVESIIEKLMLKTLKSYENRSSHSFPVTKSEAREKMRESDGCYREFYKQMRKAL